MNGVGHKRGRGGTMAAHGTGRSTAARTESAPAPSSVASLAATAAAGQASVHEMRRMCCERYQWMQARAAQQRLTRPEEHLAELCLEGTRVRRAYRCALVCLAHPCMS